jgi:hypothetical protein
MVASIAVEPFLFAALFIELAVLLAIPMLVSMNQTPGRGVVRFFIYQTLAMPFILLAGWLLSGVAPAPAILRWPHRLPMLGLALALLLAIFPCTTGSCCSWIILAVCRWFSIVDFANHYHRFWRGFLDRYSWLRSRPQTAALQLRAC